jgi:hypothetical protein
MDFVAVGTECFVTAMLFDIQRDLGHIDLLDDARPESCRTQSVAAVRATRARAMVDGIVDQFLRKQGAFVLGMAGLPPRENDALALCWRSWQA